MSKKKMVICRNCNGAIEKNTKICPLCGAKNKKPFYKKGWFIILVIIFIIAIVSAIGGNEEKNDDLQEIEVQTENDDLQETEIETENEPDVNAGQEVEPTEPEDVTNSTDAADGIRPEFVEAMNSYEEFMNQYCDFMEKYAESDGTDVGMLTDYAEYMSKYAEVVEDFDAWNSEEMSTEETAYYIEVQTRINEKLLEVAE